MKNSCYTETQIVKILKEVEGGMEASDIKWLKELEDENQRLKSMFAGLSLEH